MPDQAVDLHRLPTDREIVLAEMQTAVIVLDAGRQIEFSNQQARLLLGFYNVAGLSLDELFSFCGVEGRLDLPVASHLLAACLARLGDGRHINIKAKQLPGGGWVLTLDDISSLVYDAELAQRDPLTGFANRTMMDPAHPPAWRARAVGAVGRWHLPAPIRSAWRASAALPWKPILILQR